jgi:hypothetical protein
MSNYEVGNLLISSLTLVVLLFTLLAMRRYTRATRRLVDATVEQISRPFMTVLERPDLSDEATLEGCASSIREIQTLRFKNGGTGPAVKLRYRVGADAHHTPDATAIATGDVLDSHHPRNALADPCEFVLEYESLGGAKYRSRGVIEGRKWVKNLTFERIEG